MKGMDGSRRLASCGVHRWAFCCFVTSWTLFFASILKNAIPLALRLFPQIVRKDFAGLHLHAVSHFWSCPKILLLVHDRLRPQGDVSTEITYAGLQNARIFQAQVKI